MEHYDYLCKAIMIGDSGVGKSSLMRRFCDDKYDEGFLSTIGVDFSIKTMSVGDDSKTLKLQIWDCAGQERFRSIVNSYYRGSHIVICVYDITDRDSLMGSMKKWLEDVNRYASENIVKVLVGNKCDLESRRAIQREEGRLFAETNGFYCFYETSAKTADHVSEVFSDVAVEVVRHIKVDVNCSKPPVDLGSSQPLLSRKRCC
jgi:Ras-related protein Rab-1A